MWGFEANPDRASNRVSNLILQVISLLSVPPGNLVYHLVTAFVLYAMALMAVSAGRRLGWSADSMRLALASLGMLAGRAALITAALLASAGLARAEGLLPPMERFVDLISIGLVAWAFVPLAAEFPQASSVLLIGNLVIGALAYAVVAINWYGQPSEAAAVSFNKSVQDWVWTVWALALLALAGSALLVRRRDDWGLVGAACAVLAAGYLLHLGVGEPAPHSPGWVRLGNLVAYPLLAGVMLRRTMNGRTGADMARTFPVPWQALEACRRVFDEPDLDAALQRVVSSVGAALDADVAAVGLIQPGARSVDLAAVQCVGQPPHSGASFDLDTQPAIRNVVAWRQPATLVGGEEPAQATLRALLGGGSGPLFIYPLLGEQDVVGLLIVGRRKGREWDAAAQPWPHILAAELAAGLAHRRRVERLSADLAQRDAALQRAREQAARLAAQLADEQSKWDKERADYAARLRRPQAGEVGRVEVPRVEAAGPQTVRRLDQADALAFRQLFVEEALKHLATMGGALDRLKQARDEEALAQLFRSAHTLKSMASAMNHTMVARMVGLVGDAVKRVRAGGLGLSAELLALADDTLSLVRVLLEDVRAAQMPSVDVAPLLERWGPFMAHAAPAPPAVAPGAALQVRIELTPDCQLKAVRAMVILAQLRRLGKVLACRPEESALRTGRIEGEFVISVATEQPPAEVQAAIASIADVARVQVQ